MQNFRKGWCQNLLEPAIQEALKDLLLGPGIRFHVKHLVLTWLGGLPDLSDVEQDVVDAAFREERLQDHVIELTYGNSVGWMRRLFARGTSGGRWGPR